MKKRLIATLTAVALAVPLGTFAWMGLQPAEPSVGPGDGTGPSDGATRAVDATAAGEPEGGAPPRPIAWVRAETPGDGPVRYLSGIVRAGERAPLAFETGGRVERVDVAVGDAFAAGDTLATLDDIALELELEEREAALAEAEASLADGRRDFERKRTLYRDGVEAEASFLTAEAQLATLESRVAVARTLIESARERLADATLVAPFAGSVAERLIEPAEFVQAGAPVLEVLGEAGGHEITVRVPDTLIDRIDPSGVHRVRVGRVDPRELDARVVEIGSRASAGAAFPVTLRIDEDDASSRAGVVAEVRLELRRGDAADGSAVRVPATAVVAGANDASHVFVVDERARTVHRRQVRVASVEGEHALVIGELIEGEAVASRGAGFLTDGQRVELLGVGIARFDI